jgi:hypothetical protein
MANAPPQRRHCRGRNRAIFVVGVVVVVVDCRDPRFPASRRHPSRSDPTRPRRDGPPRRCYYCREHYHRVVVDAGHPRVVVDVREQGQVVGLCRLAHAASCSDAAAGVAAAVSCSDVGVAVEVVVVRTTFPDRPIRNPSSPRHAVAAEILTEGTNDSVAAAACSEVGAGDAVSGNPRVVVGGGGVVVVVVLLLLATAAQQEDTAPRTPWPPPPSKSCRRHCPRTRPVTCPCCYSFCCCCCCCCCCCACGCGRFAGNGFYKVLHDCSICNCSSAKAVTAVVVVVVVGVAVVVVEGVVASLSRLAVPRCTLFPGVVVKASFAFVFQFRPTQAAAVGRTSAARPARRGHGRNHSLVVVEADPYAFFNFFRIAPILLLNIFKHLLIQTLLIAVVDHEGACARACA